MPDAHHKVRIYEPLWEELKAKSEVRLSADPSYHNRIFRMVSKERNNDAAFKLYCWEKYGSTAAVRLRRENDPKDRNILIIKLWEI